MDTASKSEESSVKDETASNPSVSAKQLDVDEFLEYVGQFGRIQIILQVMFCCIIIPSTNQTLVMTFVGHNPPWQCSRISSECNQTGSPRGTGSFDVDDKFYDSRCSMENRSSWKFTKPKKYSIITEWDLVCEHKELSYLANSALFIGWGIGSVVLGAISDRFGRKSVLFPSIAVVMIGGTASAFSHHFWQFFVFRLIIGLGEGGVTLSVFVMATELVGPKYRALSGSIIWFFFAAALCLTAMNAWLLPDWRKLEMVSSAPYLFVLAFYMFVPESIRWLRVNDKLDDAMVVLRRVARINRRPMPNATLTPAIKRTVHGTYLDLFRPWPACKSTLIQCYAWFINGMVYYGIALASDDLGGNLYRDFILTSLTDIPATILLIVLANRFGRKPTVIWSMFIGAIACIGVGIIPHATNLPEIIWSRVSLGMLGKLCIALSFNTLYIWSVELFPTIVRSQGMGLLLVSSRFGGATAPWVAKWLKTFHVAAPFSVMGGLTMIASLVCFQLKETNKRATREVLEDELTSPKSVEAIPSEVTERSPMHIGLEHTEYGIQNTEYGLIFKKGDSYPCTDQYKSTAELVVNEESTPM